MSRSEAWLLHAANLLVGGTGIAYAWMLYLLVPADPYAVVNHPLQPLTQHAHVWSAPLLVFAVGLVWKRHAWRQYAQGVQPRRRSGAALLAAFAPLVVSGYTLQTAVDPGWRRAWLAIHLATAVLWLAATASHQLARRRLQRDPELDGRAPSL